MIDMLNSILRPLCAIGLLIIIILMIKTLMINTETHKSKKYEYKTNYDSCQLIGFIDGIPMYDCPTKLDTIK